MKIGLISDVHASPGPLRAALSMLREAGAEMILCAGDIAGYGRDLESTVTLLQENQCRCIVGNHDLWWLDDHEGLVLNPVRNFLNGLPRTIGLTLAGVRLFMVHASPPDSLMDGIRLLDEDGRLRPEQQAFWADRLRPHPVDLLVVGHTHQVFAESLGNLLIVNPGSTCFNHTCALVTLPECRVEILTLPDKEPVMAWNWGQFFSNS